VIDAVDDDVGETMKVLVEITDTVAVQLGDGLDDLEVIATD